MKKTLILLVFLASSWMANAQQTLTVSGSFLNQNIPVINQPVTITYNTLDSLNPILGYDTTMTDSLGLYSFTRTITGTNFQGYVIVKTNDCFGSTQEMYGVFFPSLNNIQINFECANLCINSFAASVDSIPSIGLMAKFKVTTFKPSSNYQWTFGDGTSGTGYYVDHIYANPGTYTVCLTTIDTFGNCT